MAGRLDRLRKRHRGEEPDGGFTLIELLIVVVILGILAAIVVFAVQNLSGESAQSACESDVRTVESALELYRAQVGGYPGGTVDQNVTITTVSSGVNGGIDDLMGTATDTANGTTFGPWLKEAPINPQHYEISVSTDGQGTINVDKPGDASAPLAASPKHNTADCSAVT